MITVSLLLVLPKRHEINEISMSFLIDWCLLLNLSTTMIVLKVIILQPIGTNYCFSSTCEYEHIHSKFQFICFLFLGIYLFVSSARFSRHYSIFVLVCYLSILFKPCIFPVMNKVVVCLIKLLIHLNISVNVILCFKSLNYWFNFELLRNDRHVLTIFVPKCCTSCYKIQIFIIFKMRLLLSIYVEMNAYLKIMLDAN